MPECDSKIVVLTERKQQYDSMIQTVDLTKKFNDFVANDHINLDVKEQEIKCIVGENGAGKSTMMNMPTDCCSQQAEKS